MTLIELKKSIHEKIDGVNDEHVLEQVQAILNQRMVFVIPEHTMEGILEGEDDIKSGRLYTQEDFEKKYEKWLKK